MSAATPRTISNAPDLRQLLAAVGALILAVALLVAVTISRQSSFEATSAVAPATVNHDHGWSSSAGQGSSFSSGGMSTVAWRSSAPCCEWERAAERQEKALSRPES